ncbi:MAG TPA: BrnT family toxin [Alphaproteobacteria bacterium]|nr:BrnT family toxin [Alphaproteobacteria bacterium]
MHFEYDPGKSRANKAKHGIDFEEAQQLWKDQGRLEIPASDAAEDRVVVLGKINGRHWSAIITYRNESIRLISVRRSRKEEVALYENLET